MRLILPLAFLLALPFATRAEGFVSKHVTALFSKLGCNGGACHGAVRGQNGFRLSLFGADPLADRERILREVFGRRINLNDPAASLILQKASGQVMHQGGKRTEVGSWEYEVIRVDRGAQQPMCDEGGVKELRVTPVSRSSSRAA